jgi:hypothetical protein
VLPLHILTVFVLNSALLSRNLLLGAKKTAARSPTCGPHSTSSLGSHKFLPNSQGNRSPGGARYVVPTPHPAQLPAKLCRGAAGT